MGIFNYKSIKTIIFLFFFIFIISINYTFLASTSRGLTVSPGVLYVDLKDFRDESIIYSITVWNKKNHSININTEVIHPNDNSFAEGFSNIPDVSWIKTEPINFSISAKESGSYDVIIDLPEYINSSFFNENWEVWINTKSYGSSDGGSVVLQTALNTRILIITPKGPIDSYYTSSFNYYIVFTLIVGLISFVIIFSYIRKK